MSEVYVVMGFDNTEGPTGIVAIYTDPVVAQEIADQESAKLASYDGGATVETWELNNRQGHRTKTSYVVINDAPHRYNPEWVVREPRIEDAELSEPDEWILWSKIGHRGGEHDQVRASAPTAERAQEMMREAMDNYQPEDTHTTNRVVRIPDSDWEDLETKVGARHRAQLIRDFIAWYLRRPGAKLPRRPEAANDT